MEPGSPNPAPNAPPPQPGGTLLDRLIDQVIAALQNWKSTNATPRQLFGWFGKVALGATLVYVAALALMLAMISGLGERFWFTSFLLYLPVQGWLLPLGLLAPFCLLFRPRLLWLHAACIVFVMFVYRPWHWGSSSEPTGRSLTLITANIGQRNNQSMEPFLTQHPPDLMVVQEAPGRAGGYARAFPKYHVSGAGEHVLISRFPIKATMLLPITNRFNMPAGCKFEVDWEGTKLIVYSIHLPTPRGQLENLKGFGFFAAVAGREDGYGRRLRHVTSDFWDTQLHMADALAQEIASQKDPVIVMGDFNAPEQGRVYERISQVLTDVYRARGSGAGLTFPGYTRNPLSLFGPWLRLDYIWINDQFRPLSAEVEPRVRSQHRAVTARVELKKQ